LEFLKLFSSLGQRLLHDSLLERDRLIRVESVENVVLVLGQHALDSPVTVVHAPELFGLVIKVVLLQVLHLLAIIRVVRRDVSGPECLVGLLRQFPRDQPQDRVVPTALGYGLGEEVVIDVAYLVGGVAPVVRHFLDGQIRIEGVTGIISESSIFNSLVLISSFAQWLVLDVPIQILVEGVVGLVVDELGKVLAIGRAILQVMVLTTHEPAVVVLVVVSPGTSGIERFDLLAFHLIGHVVRLCLLG